jgi:phage terminase small subunit
MSALVPWQDRSPAEKDSTPPALSSEAYRAFADAYLETMNQTRSAILAGYSEFSATPTGYRLLRTPEIRAYLEWHWKRDAMQREEIKRRLTDIARLDLTEVLDASGKVNMQLVKEKGLSRFILESNYDSNGNLKVRFMSPEKAMELLGKAHKMFGDSNEISGAGGGPAIVEIRFVSTSVVSPPLDALSEETGEEAEDADE